MKNMNYKKLAFGIPSLFSIGLTIFISYIFYFNFLPSHIQKYSIVSGFALGVVHTVLATMTLWSLMKTMLTDPGYLPRNFYKNPSNIQEAVMQLNKKHYEKNNLMTVVSSEEPIDLEAGINNENLSSDSTDELDANNEIVEQKQQENLDNEALQNQRKLPLSVVYQRWQNQEEQIDQMFNEDVRSFIRFRYCHKCKQVKPPRTHHCSVCNQCVMRMDHHCPWVGNCVGINNHKFFWNFLFYAFLGTTHACLALFLGKNSINELQKDVGYMLAGVLSLAFSISIGFLFIVHTFILMKNLSTLEMGGLMIKNPFSQGSIRENMQQTLGKDWRFWLIPIETGDRGCDGINHSIIPCH